MKINISEHLVAVAVLSLMGGIVLQSTTVSAAATSVGVTITGVTPGMAAKAKEAAAEQAALEEAWLQTEIDDSEPVEVTETIGGQTTHYWESADGSRSTTAPAEVQDETVAAPEVAPEQFEETAVEEDQPAENFKPMPKKHDIDQKAIAFKQLTTDWASNQIMSSLEDLITKAFQLNK
ncbi:hypothetical protein [Latilactobacillus curvatus]|uniref:Uncharacterized protein n=1 Tax=Latilactobacillus curvatus JCM 1096 = DSM 20019 TaxID=1293592 RepID=A0AAJ0LEB5_LATCU|nr:hypothetical protein [Latilactobacillus curvatus]KRK91571.1 hypothetical protein FC08_GL001197 [Latilactobacillus curvatus JCM 1096 = DSM 20019]MCT3531305.1 hypothetical protein [Latilactobacillus curvatus]MDG2988593.1 hypothetical protein [Latilactobacillus curvatus]QAS49939.1 hypothetical protein LCU_05860 [Latilactobacillus curvatus JCM 1096 = DSM 20019]GED82017.1 hypothetical protein LCU01_09250 [Latilactobacillus curvatus]